MKTTKTNNTSFSTENQPQNKRGLSTKTLILNAIKNNTLLELPPKANRSAIEEAFISHIAQRAFNPDDNNSGMLLKLLSEKAWSNLKPTSEKVIFDFDSSAKPIEQAHQVLDAAANGYINIELAQSFISIINTTIKINEVTELEERLSALEKTLATKD
ncbi:MAG: hypothetical protein ACI88H_003630 [Cocleimonas sp.]|jgi:hypothetical protein